MESNRIQIANQSAWVHDSEAHRGMFHTYDQLALHGDHYGWHKVHVWLPPGYHGGTSRHSVVFANDGEQVFFGGGVGQNWCIQEVVQQSAAAGTTVALPILVGVEWRERSNEYVHEPITHLPFGPVDLRQGGGLGPYSNYLTDRIVPFIDANYRTIRDRQRRVVLGSSHGGLAAFFTGVSHGDVFGQVIAMSSWFWAGTMKPLRQSKLYRWTAGNLRKVETRPRIYIDWGLQRGGGYHNTYIEAWATSRGEDMRDILLRDHGYVEGVDLMAVADPDGQHNEDTWRRRLPGALRFALGT
jgi:enterochelin esterase-like enzyme